MVKLSRYFNSVCNIAGVSKKVSKDKKIKFTGRDDNKMRLFMSGKEKSDMGSQKNPKYFSTYIITSF